MVHGKPVSLGNTNIKVNLSTRIDKCDRNAKQSMGHNSTMSKEDFNVAPLQDCICNIYFLRNMSFVAV